MTKKTKKKPSKLDESMEEFRVQARDAFASLVPDFGFHEERIPFAEDKYLNPCAVWYANSRTRVVIEGINWGMNTRIALGRAGSASQFENYDFLELLEIRDEEAVAAGQSGRGVSGGQLEQLRQYAALLPEAAADVLRGPFDFPGAGSSRRAATARNCDVTMDHRSEVKE